MFYYESKAVTDIGNKREINQDNLIALQSYTNNKSIGVYCVADGMGGLNDGEYASRLATQESAKWYKKNFRLLSKKTIRYKKLKKSLMDLFYGINKTIYNYGRQKGIRIGTTYSLLLLLGEKYYLVHAGDSRIYLKRNGKLYLLTKDQTWVNEQVDKGLMTTEQAQMHPKKNVLTNCIGCFEVPSVCIGEGSVMLDDSFLLCSDGLYNLVTTDEISMGMSCDNLDYVSAELLNLVKSRGASDNITILLVKVVESYNVDDITAFD